MAATNKRGVFSLETVLERQSDNHWSKIPETFRYVNVLITAAPAFGYLAGGRSTGNNYLTKVDRIDYGNDTATAAPKGNIVDGGNIAGAGNQSFGYTAGHKTQCNRIDYSSDTATAVQKGTLSSARTYISAVGNRNFGYWCGGTLSKKTNIDRLDYSNDTAATTPKGPLSIPTLASAGTGNRDFGYIGGLQPGRSQTLRIDYSNDTALTTEKGSLIASGYMVAAAGNTDFGYWNSGSHGTRVGRLDYANDSVNAIFRGNTAYGGVKRAGTGSGSFGYFTGGDPAPQPTTVDRVDYANDTSIATKGPLSLGKYYHAGISAQENGLATLPIPATRTESGVTPVPNFGYVIGGSWPIVSTVDRIDYANDTPTAAVKGSLEITRSAHQSTSNPTHAYAAAGYPSRTSVSRIEFSNDTATAVAKGPLTAHHNYFGATGNTSFGYYAGSAPSVISTVDRIDYSSDTSTAVVKGPLSFAKGNAQGCGNMSFGYWAGGNGSSPAKVSSVDRVDYSNDTATASPKGPLENSRSTMAASGTSDFGYSSGGYPYYTKTSRIDYANDTATAVAKAPYPSIVTPYGFSNAAGTGNSTHGYAVGGNGYNSYVWRIDYANDTANGVQKGPLSQGRLRLSAGSPLENGLPTKSPGPIDKGAHGYTIPSLGPAYGYTAGGLGYSLYQRVDYSNDTATATNQAHTTYASPGGGTLTSSIGNNSNAFTWIAGGQGQYSSVIERYDYSADTNDSIAKGNLAETRGYMAGAVGNASYGYFMGGTNPSNSETTTVQRVDYSNDTATTTVKGPLTSVRYHNNGGVGNQSYGYIGGNGLVSGSSIDRIDYSNDTATASPKGRLTVQGGTKAATGNASYGYWGGGYPLKSNISRLDYSNDSSNTVDKGPLSAAANQFGAFGDTSYGYWTGGWNPGPNLSTVSRLDFSDDTTTAVAKGPLGTAVREHGGNSSRSNALTGSQTFIPRIRWVDSVAETPAVPGAPAHAYFIGGRNPWSSQKSVIDRIDFSNDTATASVRGPLSATRYHPPASVSSTSHAYIGGGTSPHPSDSSRIDRIDYSDDTTATAPKGSLSVARYGMGATGNKDYGYWAGGFGPSYSSVVDRVDYSNDTIAATPKGPISAGRYADTATGNQSYGYVVGGSAGSPAYVSQVDRIDYSNDTGTTPTKGPLSAGRKYMGATGNASYGYWGGGFYEPSSSASTIVERIDYGNDTATASTKGPINNDLSQQLRLSAAGDTSYGYFGGGFPFSSHLNRIDYGNDTATMSTKGKLSEARMATTATGGRTYANPSTPTAAIAAPVQPPFPFPVQLPTPGPAFGYITGGAYPGVSAEKSTIDRIDFGNDTATASPKGNTSVARKNHGAAGNRTHGYNFGGFSPSSLTDRIDYANDTATAAPKGLIVSEGPAGKGYVHTGGTESFGYIAGGYVPSSYGSPTNRSSTIDRLDYSNDSANTLSKGGLSDGRSSGSFTGNQSFGYQCGGKNPGVVSTVFRIDYGNDTATAATKGPLSATRRYNAATGNASFGYVATNGNNSDTSVDRIDYSNDTATASPKGPLSSASKYMGATSTSSFGYFAGGQSSSNVHSRIDRIDYSSDTSTTSPKGNLSIAKNKSAGVSARQSGLPN